MKPALDFCRGRASIFAQILTKTRRKTALAAWRLPWAGLITGFSIVQAVFSDC